AARAGGAGGGDWSPSRHDPPGGGGVRRPRGWAGRPPPRPPRPPAPPVFPADAGRTDGTDVAFEWRPAEDPDGDAVADYHFQLSDRPDMAWPLSSNFEKLVSNTADRGHARYRLPQAGLLTPGVAYYWRGPARGGPPGGGAPGGGAGGP